VCLVGISDQFSTCCIGLFMSPLQEWSEYFSFVIASVEFASTWKHSYHVESGGIPDNCDHQLVHSTVRRGLSGTSSPDRSQIDS
jgi:hypothetical protein